MTPLAETLLILVELHGVWVLFLLAVAETCFVTGLVVPSGVATSLATILAMNGSLSLAAVGAAALAGGWVGDSLGFWIGRRGGAWLSDGDHRFARLYRDRRREADRIFAGHPFVSVTLARLISFVRTLMPMAAGMSGLEYRRFLVFEALGVSGWVALYVALGLVAGESWEAAARWFGAGGAVVFLVACLLFWRVARGRAGRRRGAVC